MSLIALPVVAFDETGNTGQNLLDVDQPVFALASVHMDVARAQELVTRVARNGAAEARFATVRTSNPGRKRLLQFLNHNDISRDEARIAVYHKSFLITTKIVDLLVEDFLYDLGHDLYEDAGHLALANLLQSVTPVFCGIEPFLEWQRRFVEMVRTKTTETVAAFYEQIEVLRRNNSHPPFAETLDLLAATRTVVDTAIPIGEPLALDPSVPALVALAAEWTAALGTPFELVHDRSKPIELHVEEFVRLTSLNDVPRMFEHAGTSIALPIATPGIRFADSQDLPQLQIADLLAGAAGYLFRTRSRAHHDSFAEQIAKSDIPGLVTNIIWPDTAVTPDELGARERPGSKELNFILELRDRTRARLERK